MGPSYPADYPKIMSTYRVIDHDMHGLVALAFPYPQIWQAQGEVRWNFENTAQPCQISVEVRNPLGLEGWQLFPAQSYYWSDLGPAEGTFSRGQTAWRPRPIVDSLQQFVLPKFRGQCADLKVVRVSREPRLAPLASADFFEAVVVRVEYSLGGQPVEEDFLALQVVRRSPGGGQINWGFERLHAFRAGRGQLDATASLYRSMLDRVKINPEWQRLHAESMARLDRDVQIFQQQVADYHRATQLAAQRQLTYIQESSQVSQRIYDYKWYVDEHIQQGRQDTLGGVESYHDPYYGTSQHGYYSFVWSDGSGNYQYSDDPLYNPNLNSSLSWALLQKLA